MLTREQILAVPPPALGSIDVPEWGGAIRLRTLTLTEMLEWEAAGANDRRAVAMVRLAAADDTGAPLFTAEDDAFLAGQPWPIINRLARAAMEHNGLSAAAQEAAAGN